MELAAFQQCDIKTEIHHSHAVTSTTFIGLADRRSSHDELFGRRP